MGLICMPYKRSSEFLQSDPIRSQMAFMYGQLLYGVQNGPTDPDLVQTVYGFPEVRVGIPTGEVARQCPKRV